MLKKVETGGKAYLQGKIIRVPINQNFNGRLAFIKKDVKDMINDVYDLPVKLPSKINLVHKKDHELITLIKNKIFSVHDSLKDLLRRLEQEEI